ncbi:MAG: dipeptidyl carboxypeptidase II, partial [Burkholderiaceae bacterium]|nr:dipeptidyl carboxypeptidase II [Burkholderiaceae bacterium]
MRPSYHLIAVAGLILATAADAQDKSAASAPTAKAAPAIAKNPLFAPSPLPYHMPQFDKIKDSDFVPAFNEAMRVQLAEVKVIADNKQAPTFENTIVALDRSGQMLDRANKTFGNLHSANTDDTIDAIDAKMSPRLAAHSDTIMLNKKLYARVKSLYEQRDKLGLDPESAYLLERYHTDFLRAGAELSAADIVKLKKLNAETARWSSIFQRNVLKEVDASAVVVDTKAELDGMSDSEIAAAADRAKARGLAGKYVITLQNTTGQPVEGELSNRALRQRIYEASVARGSRGGEFDNREAALMM